jgi:hypothetical protein
MSPRVKRNILALATLFVAFGVAAVAQPPQGRGMGHGRGMMMDDSQKADMEVFHQLFDHRTEIRREITSLRDGVDTLTESDNPKVTELLQRHLDSMVARVHEARPIHQRDPLFREIFANSQKIRMDVTRTPKGVRVIETSDDPYVAKLIKQHADVIGLFIQNGRSEAMKDHPVGK